MRQTKLAEVPFLGDGEENANALRLRELTENAASSTRHRAANLRLQLMQLVDAVIEYLDEMDGDPDFEPELVEDDDDAEQEEPSW